MYLPREDVFLDTGRLVVWFSCGAASTIATKLTLDSFRNTKEVCVCAILTPEQSMKIMLDLYRK